MKNELFFQLFPSILLNVQPSHSSEATACCVHVKTNLCQPKSERKRGQQRKSQMLRIESENKAFRAVCFNVLKCLLLLLWGYIMQNFIRLYYDSCSIIKIKVTVWLDCKGVNFLCNRFTLISVSLPAPALDVAHSLSPLFLFMCMQTWSVVTWTIKVYCLLMTYKDCPQQVGTVTETFQYGRAAVIIHGQTVTCRATGQHHCQAFPGQHTRFLWVQPHVQYTHY